MTTWYSDVFSGSAGASSLHAGYQAPAGRQDYPKKLSRVDLRGAAAVAAMATLDTVVFQPIDPRDRLVGLVVTADALFNAATSWTLDLGLHRLTGVGTLGSVIDLNLFATLVNIDATPIPRIDLVIESASLTNLHRGLRFWEIANVTGAGLTRAPNETWAITGTFNIVGAVSAGGEIQVEAEILSG